MCQLSHNYYYSLLGSFFLGVASYYAHHETFHVSILTHFRCWSNVSPYSPPIGEHIEASNGSYRIKFNDAHATEVFRLFDTKMRQEFAHAGWDFLFFFFFQGQPTLGSGK